jgi:hypothetical protein
LTSDDAQYGLPGARPEDDNRACSTDYRRCRLVNRGATNDSTDTGGQNPGDPLSEGCRVGGNSVDQQLIIRSRQHRNLAGNLAKCLLSAGG